jgi:hypothetical protein
VGRGAAARRSPHPAKRLRELAVELGYAGSKTIFDDYVRELRPRFLARRTSSARSTSPVSSCSSTSSSPRAPIPVGHGQLRRGYVLTAELC